MTQWDIVAYNRNQQLVLAVEVKNKLDASPEWAAKLRRNILAYGNCLTPPYFLIALPDKFYLWKETTSSPEQSEPSYIVDARPMLQSYLDQAGIHSDQLSGSSLELIVAAWLGELIHSDIAPDKMDEQKRWLVESGLYEAVVGGSLEHEIAA